MLVAGTGPNLIENGDLVESFWRAVNSGRGNIDNIPGLIRRVIETGAWRKRIYKGKTFEHARFIDFITAKPLAGCGWKPQQVEALIKDQPEILELWNSAIGLGRGTRRDLDNNIHEVRKAQGTTRAATLSQLKRNHPALFERVIREELTANEAAIKAGFRIRKISIPLDVERAAKSLARNFSRQQIKDLVRILADKL